MNRDLDVDRKSPQECEAILIGILPDPSARLSCLRILRAGIVAAHSRATAAWSVTLFSDGLRLNIGSTEAYTLREGVVRVLILVGDTTTVPAALLASSLLPSPYKSTPPETQLFRTIPSRVVTVEPWLRDCFVNFALRASVTKTGEPRRTPYHPSHSAGVVSYLSTTLHEVVPTPDFRSNKVSTGA
jgi:hypothetical protein